MEKVESLGIALRMIALVKMCSVGSCTEVTGWLFPAAKVVMAIAEEARRLGGSILARLWGDLQTSTKMRRSFRAFVVWDALRWRVPERMLASQSVAPAW